MVSYFQNAHTLVWKTLLKKTTSVWFFYNTLMHIINLLEFNNFVIPRKQLKILMCREIKHQRDPKLVWIRSGVFSHFAVSSSMMPNVSLI